MAPSILSIYAPFRTFLTTHLQNHINRDLQLSRQCFFCLAHVLDLLRNTSAESTTPEALMAAIVRHLEFFRSTYGEEHMTPKFHMVIHLADQLRRHKLLVSCFTHERKHKEVKRFANHLQNTSKDFEASLLEAMALAHMNDFSGEVMLPSATTRLLRPQEATKEMADAVRLACALDGAVLTSRTAVLPSSTQCVVKDVVACRLNGDVVVGQVWFHANVQGQCVTCISRWQHETGNRFLIADDPMIVNTSCIQDTCVYSRTATHAIVIPTFRSCNL